MKPWSQVTFYGVGLQWSYFGWKCCPLKCPSLCRRAVIMRDFGWIQGGFIKSYVNCDQRKPTTLQPIISEQAYMFQNSSLCIYINFLFNKQDKLSHWKNALTLSSLTFGHAVKGVLCGIQQCDSLVLRLPMI